MQASLQELEGQVVNSRATGNVLFKGISTDSRKITSGNLFVALKGENFDAHDFLNDVIAAGAVGVIVERIPQGFEAPALLVPDTKRALGEIARYWRQQFSLPLIAVTGSNGKTTVKEMIASILSTHYGTDRVLATKGNLNNEIGVPLTLFGLHASQQAAVLELGMNHPGEIAVLSATAQATVALVNNAQREHQEFMQTVEAVAIENGCVLQSLSSEGLAVYPYGDAFTPIWQKQAAHCQHLSFGLDPNADVSATFLVKDFGSDVELTVRGAKTRLQLTAAGQHNVLNALAATACCTAIGIPMSAIVAGLEAFSPVAGRLQPKQAALGARIIDDTYNANPDSVKAAIEVLAGASHRKILVLGDMGEVGADGIEFHREVGAYAKQCGIDVLMSLGQLAKASSQAFGESGQHFDEIQGLHLALEKLASSDNTILVKGSRFMKMERVVAQLMYPTQIENQISLKQ
ncbi:UDP-N-acetylmuramoyl-tripeptide--D-alanyl-D-alanine ligase [Undibacterium fentianense]|uniref:UDP-N-acetylmuramoyl-tripeptide--D-alanyl-D-alanine ligase n=1 Tax=Undibacterium fentianense TaxID=2828728 RepID=A0A941E268_9BURK|nr:UDP-N-acetylmuramoyl-tripeptide--D-alanyl-D-alanine ligase [Undibacterium fentianense]MBR7799616.1 UDP-N-acetylmuramoyl-tripeptide--D-alanyl-D-alanine ligase [Undibacterium fentianense]